MSAMAYGNNVYIAVGYYGAIVKSADAETWVNVKTKADINYTGVTAPGSFTFNGAAYGKGLFVVTGSEGVILTSPDGNTWTQRSSGVTTGIWSTEFLTFNGSSAFYATTQGKLLTSPDGINWTSIVPTGVDSSLTLTKVTVGNGGTRLAVGGANGRIYSTTNGTAWTSAQPSTADGQSIGTNMLTWMNDRYYISDPMAYIWTSTDLSTFTLLGPPFKQNASQHNNQMFNGFYDGTKYYMFGYESPNYGAVYTSTNGTTWTMQPFKNYFVTQNARYLDGKYFRLGNEGMLVSSDGADWRYKWGGAFTEIVHGSGSQYVAVGKTGGDGAIWNSADLAQWNQVTLSPRTTGFTAAAYGNNTYVAIGENNQTTTALATSPDGKTWTLRSGINDSTTLSDIAFGNGKFVAVGSGAGGPKIKTSEDGISWHEPALPVQSIDAVYSIAYTNNQFIALGYGYSDEGYLNAASIWTSADGETWSNRSGAYPNQTDGFNNLLYDGSKYVLTGYDSSTYEVFSRSSDDLTTWSNPTLTGTYTYFSSSAMLGQKGNTLYMLAYDSSNTPVVYYTADHGSTWRNAGVDMSSIDPNAIYSLMEADGRVLLSGNSQLVMTTTGTMAQVEAPTANPAGGAVAPGTTVALSSSTSGAAIHYTLDGSVPTSSSPEYSGPIPVTGAVTIKAIAVKAGMTDSAIMSEAYTIMAQVEAPTANPAGGAVASGTTVALSSSTSGAAIHYTLDGSVPTSSSPEYSGPIPVTGAVTIKAIAVKAGMTDSAVMSEAYTLSTEPEPDSIISPVSAAFDKKQTQQADVTIELTLNGNTLIGISNGIANLTAGTDYTLSGSTVTISKTYLASLAAGTTSLTFRFSAGAAQTLDMTITDTTVPIPGVPLLQSAVFGNAQVQLIWTPVEGSTGYKIFQRLADTEYGSEVATVSGSVYSYNAVNLLNGTTYYFVVKAANAEGDSAASNELSATPKTAPGAPANVTAVSGNGQAVVSFTAPDSDGGSSITGYEVTSSPGNIVAYGTASPITVTGLTNGTGYTFTVKAVNSAGSSTTSALSNTVMPIAPSSGGGDTPPSVPAAPAAAPPAVTGFNVLVNGKVENAGTITTATVNGQTALTVAIDQTKLEEKLAAEGQGAVVTIPVTVKSDIVIAELNGQMVKDMEDKQAVLELKSENATYTLPAGQINMDAIRSQFGTAATLGDIKVKLEIAAPAEDTLRTVENSAVQGGFTLVAPPLNFVVRAEYGGQTVEISKFSAYVERQIALPDGVDPNKITTAIVVEPNGSVRHVPTRVTTIDQKYYAKVNSLTNSTYSIIWHPLEFKDVAGHWAKDIVNNMGSRMIIDGTGNGLFNPDAEITRAEFAAVIVRGLGLKLDSSAASFADVKAEAWYSSAVQTAYAYHLVNGFEDGTFRPADKITREQAMAIIAKAMKLTSLQDKLPVQSSAELLSPFKDASKVSQWAQSSAADSIEAGIVSGRSASELAPQAYITRAEVAAIVQRLLQKSNLI
ncbi:chitobiase/beta-hexosaminidase C-terminal domain-containing protein [Paenibacillus sonchi]|uniref:Chitobiase/beta-hexosaminidase C-terminal domain-containing protein n=4 Tax=Paenibacillus sonchi TaxID=373687 RepID=A0A974PHR0_9BACL|nr:chitobiase/beta-hexosaminidase C-terminal domain-containing protein [Paenibacillus sonchi]